MQEINFFATLSYVRKWRQSVQNGIPDMCTLYETAQEHAAEAFAFERIRGSVQKALHNMKKNHRAKEAWNLYGTAVAKTISTLENEKGEIKGVSLLIVNTGGAAAFREMLRDVSFASNRLHRLKTGKQNVTQDPAREMKRRNKPQER